MQLVTAIDETFYKTYETGSLGNVPRNILIKTRNMSHVQEYRTILYYSLIFIMDWPSKITTVLILRNITK